jgi:CspA family cold shock protein
VTSRNRDFRSQRRHGFEDDNYEPPGRNFGYAAPGGTQFEAPTGPSTQAVVKWYNPAKGFGFVELVGGAGDAFLHVSVLERGGHGVVPPGATLEVRISMGQKGAQITEVISVDASTAGQEQPRRPRPERPGYSSPADRATVEEFGTVKWYNAIKEFGFIASDRGGKDIFVHASALDSSGVMGLAEGQRVAIDVAQGNKGPEAVRVRLI